MRFKIKKLEKNKHTDIVTAIAWNMSNELVSVSEDLAVYKWDFNGEPVSKQLDLDVPCVDMDWFPTARTSSELLAVACSNGSIKLLSKAGRIEKSVEKAHNGSITCIKWTYDGAALATAGEDGCIKVWSKNIEMRSALVQVGKTVYGLCWSPDNNSILYCSSTNLTILPTVPGNKKTTWKAHDNLVLVADWNTANNLIVSGGEDCKYRIWDSYGRLIYCSAPYDYVITSISWAPSGEVFAVGSYNLLRLCDKAGWTHAFEKPNAGSLMKLSWSSDGTAVAGAGGNGSVVFGYLVDRALHWGYIEATLEEDNKVQVTDVMHEVSDELDFRDRVVNMSLGYNYLVVTTTVQCYIYNVMNWDAPVIFDIKDIVTLIVQGSKHFCLVDRSNGLMIYNYSGTLMSSPKYSGLRVEFLNKRVVTLGPDVISILDTSNPKIIRSFDIATGKPAVVSIEHGLDITDLTLNQTENPSERKIAFMDVNKDLFISPVHKPEIVKISSMVDTFMWNEQNDILACVADSRLICWLFPNGVYVDRELMEQAKVIRDVHDLGKYPQMICFNNSLIQLRRFDGALAAITTLPHANLLHDLYEKTRWEKAITLCRFVKEPTLWACLAIMSISARELNTAEIALAATDEADKVQYINYVKELPSDAARNAALSIYCKKYVEAENILLQAKLFYRAIKMNIKLFKWERALEIAVRNKTHVDTVLAYRQRYLQTQGKKETNDKFMQLAEKVEINWETIKEKIRKDKESEAKAAGVAYKGE